MKRVGNTGINKISLSEDQIDVFADIEILLNSPAISANRQHIDKLKQKITIEKCRRNLKNYLSYLNTRHITNGYSIIKHP